MKGHTAPRRQADGGETGRRRGGVCDGAAEAAGGEAGWPCIRSELTVM